jgi:hypothetical protein
MAIAITFKYQPIISADFFSWRFCPAPMNEKRPAETDCSTGHKPTNCEAEYVAH